MAGPVCCPAEHVNAFLCNYGRIIVIAIGLLDICPPDLIKGTGRYPRYVLDQ